MMNNEYDFSMESLLLKSVLKRRVQFRLIASLTARAHGKMRSLSKSLVARATNYRTIILITNSIKICITCHLREARFHMDY